MNITEIIPGRKARAHMKKNTYERVEIKAVSDDGKVLVRNSFGDIKTVPPTQILKQFDV